MRYPIIHAQPVGKKGKCDQFLGAFSPPCVGASTRFLTFFVNLQIDRMGVIRLPFPLPSRFSVIDLGWFQFTFTCKANSVCCKPTAS